jgi:tRNA-dihydrouridine synthase B
MLPFADYPIVALSPLAGYTDLPFRKVVKQYGADWTISEMINGNALAYENEKTLKMIQKNSNETPYSVQIAVNSPEVAKKAVEILNRYDFIDGIDLNVGCPVKKAIKSGYGGNLLKEPDNLAKIVETIAKTHNKTFFSVKMRIGFDEINGVERAKLIEESGADILTVHGRTVKQLYKGQSNYEVIAQIKSKLKIPIIANGDIDSYQKAQEVLEYTKADGVMIGRGAVGSPWIFREIKEGRGVTDEEKREVVISHFQAVIEWYGEYGVVLFRKHLHTYSKGLKGASEFRVNINRVTDSKEMLELIKNFFKG